MACITKHAQLAFYSICLSAVLSGCGGSSSSHNPTEPTPVANAAPVAKITAPAQVFAGQGITLSCEGSSDTDGEIKSYRWQLLTEQGQLHNSDQCQAQLLTANTNSHYEIELTITDDKQASAKAKHTIESVLYAGAETALDAHPWQMPTIDFNPGTVLQSLWYREYLLVLNENRLSVLNVSQLNNPQVASLTLSNAFAMAIEANTLYVVDKQGDISRYELILSADGSFDGHPKFIDKQNVPQIVEQDKDKNSSFSNKKVIVKNQHLYINFGGYIFDGAVISEGVVGVIDVTANQPAKWIKGIEHEVRAATSLALHKDTLVINGGQKVSFYGLDKPAEPEFLSSITVYGGGVSRDFAVLNDTAYVVYPYEHNGRSLSEFKIIDFADVTQPKLIGSWQGEVDRNQLITDGNRLFSVNAQMEIIEFDLSQRLAPKLKSSALIPDAKLLALSGNALYLQQKTKLRHFALSSLIARNNKFANDVKAWVSPPFKYGAQQVDDALVLAAALPEEFSEAYFRLEDVPEDSLSVFDTSQAEIDKQDLQLLTQDKRGRLFSGLYGYECTKEQILSKVNNDIYFIASNSLFNPSHDVGALATSVKTQTKKLNTVRYLFDLPAKSATRALKFEQFTDELYGVDNCWGIFSSMHLYKRSGDSIELVSSIEAEGNRDKYIGLDQQYLYTAKGNELKIWQHQKASGLKLSSLFQVTENIKSGIKHGNYFYLLTETHKLLVLSSTTSGLSLSKSIDFSSALSDIRSEESIRHIVDLFPVITGDQLVMAEHSPTSLLNRRHLLLWNIKNPTDPVYSGRLSATGAQEKLIYETGQFYLAYVPHNASLPELTSYDFIQPELADIDFSANSGQQLSLALSWTSELEMNFDCQVTAGQCEIAALDKANKKAQVRWSLPAESGDYELTLFNKTHRQLGVQKRQVRVQ